MELPWNRSHRQVMQRLAEIEGQMYALIVVVERSAKTLPTSCAHHPDFDPATMANYEDSCSPCRAAAARFSILSVCRIVREATQVDS
jgi:hypothetical protein